MINESKKTKLKKYNIELLIHHDLLLKTTLLCSIKAENKQKAKSICIKAIKSRFIVKCESIDEV